MLIVFFALETAPKSPGKGQKELAEELISSRRLICSNQHKHLEESWKMKETCCHSDLSAKPQVKQGWKVYQEKNNDKSNTISNKELNKVEKFTKRKIMINQIQYQIKN